MKNCFGFQFLISVKRSLSTFFAFKTIWFLETKTQTFVLENAFSIADLNCHSNLFIMYEFGVRNSPLSEIF